MDLQMPSLDGVSAIEQICSRQARAQVAALTTYQGDVQAMRALKASARGHVLKSMVRKELTDASCITCTELRIGAEGLHSSCASVAENLSFR